MLCGTDDCDGSAAPLVVGVAFKPAMEEAVGEAQAECGVAEHLVGVAQEEVVAVDAAEGSAGRGVDVEAGVPAELLDAQKVGGVADNDDVLEVVVAGDIGEAARLLAGGVGVGLSDDGGEGDAVGEEVIAADASLGEAGVLVRAAAEGDDDGGDLPVVEGEGVIEAGVVDGGGSASVLGRTEDGDGVGGLGLILGADLVDAVDDPGGPAGAKQEQEREQQQEESTDGMRGFEARVP